MDGRQHQVAGERRLNGNLSRFGIPDFADHNLVRIMTKNRPQPSRKRQPFFLVDRNLHHARELILDRILNGNQLIFERVHFGNRGIQGGGLSTSCRAGDQDHAVGAGDGPPEPFQVLLIESQPVEPQRRYTGRDGLSIQDSDDHRFAEHARQDRDTEVHHLSIQSHAKTAVLRHTAFRNIQFGYDLEAGHKRRMQADIQRFHRLHENTVDAKLDTGRPVGGLDVDVARTALHGAQ